MLRSRARRWTTAPVLAIALLVAACGDDGDRPAADDWEPVWVRTEARVPDPDEVVAGGRDLCGEALGEVRASRQEVLPAPSSALDERVEAWLSAAETLLFECPNDRDELDDAAAELERLRSLVAADLRTRRE